jgi:hypothetical protein
MEIPNAYSAPLDPSAPSLLKLPAEIRNRISEYVFVQSEPILVHNADCYYNRGRYGPGMDRNTSAEDLNTSGHSLESLRQFQNQCYRDSLKRWELRTNAEKEDAQLFKNEVSLGLGFMKTYRQIYHETAGILYSENTFVVSRVRYSHDPYVLESCKGVCHDYHQLRYTSLWLASLGSQMNQIKTVVIDISAVCFHSSAYRDYFPNLLPLLQLIWNESLPRCKITFAHAGRRTVNARCGKSSEMLRKTASRLNKTVEALVIDDALDLRRFSTSALLLSSVSIKSKGFSGYVKYYTGPRSRIRDFNTDQASGKGLSWDVRKPATSPTDLPVHVRGFICRRLNEPRKDLRLVMNSSTPLSRDWSVFHVSSSLRKSFAQAVGEYMPVTIEFRAEEAAHEYNAAAALTRFYPDFEVLLRCPSPIGKIITASIRAHSETAKTTLLVRVLSNRPTPPEDICIHVKSLFRWLDHVTHSDKVSLSIRLESTEGGKVQYETRNTTMGRSRMDLFLHLTNLLEQNQQDGDGSAKLPELWIDGNANFVDLDVPPMVPRLSHTNLTRAGIEAKGIQEVLQEIETRQIINPWQCFYQCLCSVGDNTECMHYTWSNLWHWAKSVYTDQNFQGAKGGQSHA